MFTFDLTDEDYELPYNAPGKSSSYFELDDEFGKGRPNRRADGIKLETILGNSGDMDMERVGGPTAIATFQPDQNANGELRYPSPGGQARGPDENIRRHAGIFMGYGEQGGRQGVFILDQFDGSGRGRSRDNGETSIRFYPFERAPGDGGYRAGEFHAIRPRK